jgi:hypothetical protein
MQEPVIFLAIALPVVLLLVSLYGLDRVRRREALFRWATGNGYRLISFGQPIITEASPFPVSASKSQHVFRVEVDDRLGNRRSGWVRLGSAWQGLMSRAAEVRWESA